MHGFKSAILAIFPFYQNGTFEPVHEIQKFLWPKDYFEALWKRHTNIRNMSQGPKFRSVEVQTEDFLKNDLQHFKNSFLFGFLASLQSNIRRCPFFLYS